jgi:hypothetical protein
MNSQKNQLGMISFFKKNGFRSPFLLITELERRVSAQLLGIPAGFLEQIRGNIIRKYCSLFSSISKDIRERGERIRRDGIQLLGNQVPIDTVNVVLDLFNEKISSQDPRVKTISVHGQKVYEGIEFKAGDKEMQIMQQVMTPELITAFTAASNGGFEVLSYSIWRNHSLPEGYSSDVYSNRWHVDGARTDEFKIFVFLDDISPDHGGTIIADRHQTYEACKAGYRSRKTYGNSQSILENIENAGSISGSAGYSYIFNPNTCLHRAGVPKPSLVRTVLMIIAIPAKKIILVPKPASKIRKWLQSIPHTIGHNDPLSA